MIRRRGNGSIGFAWSWGWSGCGGRGFCADEGVFEEEMESVGGGDAGGDGDEQHERAARIETDVGGAEELMEESEDGEVDQVKAVREFSQRDGRARLED